MKKLIYNKANETIYYEKLNNGLEVYLYPKNDINNVYGVFTTKYGSVNSEFVPIGSKKGIKVPDGIAHFLEHKLFEQEEGDTPFEFYGKTGTNCNAHTSFYETSYLFKGPNNYQDNLNYLLDFVQQPYFTLENTEKEKGIIEQEINMYKDNPGWVMFEKILSNTFNSNPISISIAGTVESIYKITKDDLYTCYNTFYHPSNMFLVLTGNFDIDEALNIIKDNQDKKQYEEMKSIKTKKVKEIDKVKLEYEKIFMNVEIPLFSYNIKIPLNMFDKIDKKIRNLYLGIIFSVIFGSTSKLSENLREKEYISGFLEVDKYFTDTHLVLSLVAKTKYAEEVIQEIDKAIKNIEINEEEFLGKKNSIISSNIRRFDDIDEINDMIVESIINYNQIYNNIDVLVNNLNKKELDEIISELNLKNKSIITIYPNN